MLDLNYRLKCKHCGKKSIIKLHLGDFRRDLTVSCEHCGGRSQITRRDLLTVFENLHQFKKHIKI